MKKYIIITSIVLFSLIVLGFKKSTVNTFPLFGHLIIIDVGHGGKDPGTTYNSEKESEYNLLFANTLKKELEILGATVIMTRDANYDLSSPNAERRKRSDFNNRIKLINESNADLYISLHMNYLSDEKYYGSQVFYSSVNEQNINIAENIQKELNNFFNYEKNIKIISDDKYMYKNIEIKGVLIEYGFISNYKDRLNLKQNSYQIELAKVIIKGLLKYLT